MVFEKYLKLTLKNKIAATMAGFLLIIFGLLYFIVIPTIRDIKTMGSDIEAQRLDLEKKYIKGQSLRQLTENLKTIEPRLNTLDQIFINKNRELEFITTLESRAFNNQISQKINLTAPQATESQGFEKIGLQLFTGGKFIKHLRYLANLESLGYYVNIKSLEFSPSADGPGQNQAPADQDQTKNINALISADTYWN